MNPRLALLALLCLLISCSVFAAPKPAKGGSQSPEVHEVYYDPEVSTLTILGANFNPDIVEVRLGSVSASPLPYYAPPASTDLLTVDVSGVAEGAYTLIVSQGENANQSDQFDLALTAGGPEGPAGPEGPQGEQGPPGPEGSTGPEGQQGPQGPVGPEGPQGEGGIAGPAGPEGAPGATGPEGPQGPMGEPGPSGPEGPAGPQGTTGPEGPQGPQGIQGLTGPEGPPGPQGPAGTDGAPGPILGYELAQTVINFSDRPGASQIYGTVFCSSGKRILSGGSYIRSENNSNPYGWFLAESFPNGPNGWAVYYLSSHWHSTEGMYVFNTDECPTCQVTVFAICADAE